MKRRQAGASLPSTMTVEDLPVTIALRQTRAARRLSLSVSHVDGGVTLTTPPHCSLDTLQRFVATHRAWLRNAVAAAPTAATIDDGVEIPFQGSPVTVRWASGRRSTQLSEEDKVLHVGGASADVGRRVVIWLREEARSRLLARSRHHADQLGVSFNTLHIRDTRSRWGSCSTSGALSYSWRLVLAPASVLDYVAAHEVAHLREMNHSARFWALVSVLKPDWRDDRDWLKRHGATLHRYRPPKQPASTAARAA